MIQKKSFFFKRIDVRSERRFLNTVANSDVGCKIMKKLQPADNNE